MVFSIISRNGADPVSHTSSMVPLPRAYASEFTASIMALAQTSMLASRTPRHASIGSNGFSCCASVIVQSPRCFAGEAAAVATADRRPLAFCIKREPVLRARGLPNRRTFRAARTERRRSGPRPPLKQEPLPSGFRHSGLQRLRRGVEDFLLRFDEGSDAFLKGVSGRGHRRTRQPALPLHRVGHDFILLCSKI